MIPNNNLSVLPWYTSIDQQNANRWWLYGKVYPLYTPAGRIPPFQIILQHTPGLALSSFEIYTKEGVFVRDCTNAIAPYITIKTFANPNCDVIVYPASTPILNNIPLGQYYAKAVFGGSTLYSEVFTIVDNTAGCLKIEWWDDEDFIMDAGAIVYTYETEPGAVQFKNVLYLQSEVAKPEYTFEDETEERDGYSFPTKQISKKVYHFSFLAPEYLLDVMRFIRMSDHIQITKDGQVYSADTFLMSPEWESNGDIASVEAEFTTATVAKKIGVGYIRSMRGDFNDDFNNDFNNQ